MDRNREELVRGPVLFSVSCLYQTDTYSSLTLDKLKDFFLNFVVTSPWLLIELTSGGVPTHKNGEEGETAGESPERGVSTHPPQHREDKGKEDAEGKGSRSQSTTQQDRGAGILEEGMVGTSRGDACTHTQRFYHERGSFDLTKVGRNIT